MVTYQIKKIFIIINLLNDVILEVTIIAKYHSFRNTSLSYQSLMIYQHFYFIMVLVSFIKRESNNYHININH